MQYAKAVAAVVAAGASAAVAGLTGDQTITALEWINICIALATSAAVFTAPNVPGAAATKAALALIMAGLTTAANLVADGVTLTTLWQILAAVAGAAAVYGVRNAPERTV